MGYDIAFKIDAIRDAYNNKIKDHNFGKILTYCILSAPRDKSISRIKMYSSSNHGIHELKKRHVSYIRNKLLDFDPEIDHKYKTPKDAENFLKDLQIVEPINFESLEGIFFKVFNHNIQGDNKLFAKIFNSIYEGSKNYSSEAKQESQRGQNWYLFKEYNRIYQKLNSNLLGQ